MVFRVSVDTASPTTLVFEGQLTEQAVATIRSQQIATGAAGLLLRDGTEVSRDALRALVGLGLEVTAESAFVSRCLGSVQAAGSTPSAPGETRSRAAGRTGEEP